MFARSVDPNLLNSTLGKSTGKAQGWQSPKGLLCFSDLLQGSGLPEALEEVERLRQQNIIIRSAEKRLCWAERRELRHKADLDESVELTQELHSRRLQANRSRSDSETAARLQREAEAAWRHQQAVEDRRVRALRKAEEQRRAQDDLQRSV